MNNSNYREMKAYKIQFKIPHYPVKINAGDQLMLDDSVIVKEEIIDAIQNGNAELTVVKEAQRDWKSPGFGTESEYALFVEMLLPLQDQNDRESIFTAAVNLLSDSNELGYVVKVGDEIHINYQYSDGRNDHSFAAEKYIIEFEIPVKFDFPDEDDDKYLISQIIRRLKKGNFSIVDSFIVFGEAEPGDFRGDEVPIGSTIIIVEADFMRAIYPDFSDYLDQMHAQTIELLESGTMKLKSYWTDSKTGKDFFLLGAA